MRKKVGDRHDGVSMLVTSLITTNILERIKYGGRIYLGSREYSPPQQDGMALDLTLH